MVGRLMMLAGVVGILAASAQASSISGAGIDYGAAGGYAIVTVGPNASLTNNTGPVTGDVLAGLGSKINSSGGNNGGITGTIFYDSTETAITSAGKGFGGLQNAASQTYQSVSTTVTTNAFNDAQTLSDIAKNLAANTSFGGTFSTTQTFTFDGSSVAHPGVDVIDFNNIQNATITLSGTASSVFVINVAGLLNTNKVLTLQGGILPSNVLFNFTGTSGTVFQTSGGCLLGGVYLATDGGDFQFSELKLNGDLINTGGHIQLVSGGYVTGFGSQTAVPLPAAVWTGLAMMGGLTGMARFKRARH